MSALKTAERIVWLHKAIVDTRLALTQLNRSVVGGILKVTTEDPPSSRSNGNRREFEILGIEAGNEAKCILARRYGLRLAEYERELRRLDGEFPT